MADPIELLDLPWSCSGENICVLLARLKVEAVGQRLGQHLERGFEEEYENDDEANPPSRLFAPGLELFQKRRLTPASLGTTLPHVHKRAALF